MLGVSAGVEELEDLTLGNPEQPSTVQAVVVWFGPTDFLKMDEQLRERGDAAPTRDGTQQRQFARVPAVGARITEVPDLVRAANPETYITSSAPPFFLQHGTHDDTVPVQQSIHFASKLVEVLGGEKVRLELLEGAGHADPQFETAENVRKVLDFLDEHLR
jgi:dipeptidyl aminopeptidase/acylaminoacyl peptidase